MGPFKCVDRVRLKHSNRSNTVNHCFELATTVGDLHGLHASQSLSALDAEPPTVPGMVLCLLALY